MHPNQARIIEEAHQLFNKRGYKRVTVSDLAERMGMSKKTIYHYFPGKKEIAAAVIDQVFSQIDQTIVNASSAPPEDPAKRIQHILGRVKNEITRLSPIFYEDIQRLLPDLWHRIEQNRVEKLKFIEHVLLHSQEAGLVKDIEPRMIMLIFLEAIQALVKPDSTARHGYAMDQILDALTQIFCNGIIISK